jgi:hypothetical protein
MTILDLINAWGQYALPLVIVFTLIPLFSFIYGRLHARGRGNHAPHKYVYSVLVYLVCIPGAFSLALTAYTLFFLRANLLAVNFLIYFVPLISMAITLAIMGRNVRLDGLPGFDRITGLFALLIVAFVLALLIQRTRVWLLFHGSLATFVVVVVVLFLLLRWAARRLFYGRG